MPDRHHAEGQDVEAALRAAVAELIGVSPTDVTARVDAPGLADLTGTFHVELRLDRAPAPELDVDDDTPAQDDASAEVEPPTHAAAERVSAPPADVKEDDEVTPEELDAEADAAADFLEGLLDAFDLPGDLRIRVLEDHAEVEIAEMGNGTLIGRRGQTLDAVQELLRCALQRQFQRRCRVQIDAEGYRARRLEKLMEKAREAVDQVAETGEAVKLEPMDVFERKAIHQFAAGVAGVQSRSHGREPARRVVIEPADD